MKGCGDFDKGHAYVKKEDKYGIVDRKGEVVVPIVFDWLENFKEGVTRVRQGNKFGMYNIFGEEIVPIKYDNMGVFRSGLSMVSLDDKLGYIDKEGKEFVPLEYQFEVAALNWGQFKKGYAKIKIKDKFGIIDSTGKRFLPAVFEDVGEYAEQLIAVKKRGLWGFCDHEARLKIPYRYEYAWGFGVDTLSKVRKDDKMGYINRKGNEEIYVVYDEISEFKTKRAKVMRDGLYGLIDSKNNLVVPIQYEELEYKEQLLLARKNDKMIYINPREGSIIWSEVPGLY